MKPEINPEVDDMTEEEFLDSLDIEDYVFVLDSYGNLKNVILPENYESMSIPDSVETILKMYNLHVWNLNPVH
jgi:hypothetical protein